MPNTARPFYLSLSNLKNVIVQFCEKPYELKIFRKFKISFGIFAVLFPHGVLDRIHPPLTRQQIDSVTNFLKSLLKGEIPYLNLELDQFLLSLGFNSALLSDIQRKQSAPLISTPQSIFHYSSALPSPRSQSQPSSTDKHSVFVVKPRSSSLTKYDYITSNVRSVSSVSSFELTESSSNSQNKHSLVSSKHSLLPSRPVIARARSFSLTSSSQPLQSSLSQPVSLIQHLSSQKENRHQAELTRLHHRIVALEKEKEDYKSLYEDEHNKKTDFEINHQRQFESQQNAIRSLNFDKIKLQSQVESTYNALEKLKNEKVALVQEVELLRNQIRTLDDKSKQTYSESHQEEYKSSFFEQSMREKEESFENKTSFHQKKDEEPSFRELELQKIIYEKEVQNQELSEELKKKEDEIQKQSLSLQSLIEEKEANQQLIKKLREKK
jgi:cell division protein FtsB